MLRAMRTAASGMAAQQLNIDLVANNLANVNTTGFKKSHADFEDLLYQTMRPAGPGEGDNQIPTALQVGHGAIVSATAKVFSQGTTETTSNPLDIAIEGAGFFQVQLPDGTTGYTRDGGLRIDGNGRMTTPRGYVLQPEISIPEDATSVLVNAEGRIFVQTAGNTDSTELGQFQLARFTNPSGLEATGGNLYRQSEVSGDPTLGAPGDLGIGSVRQGALERSNVDVTEEMVNMIVAQRAFEINSKSIKTAEDMLGIINSIKR
jgi:flagellar basal-body rod protein FlgG